LCENVENLTRQQIKREKGSGFVQRIAVFLILPVGKPWARHVGSEGVRGASVDNHLLKTDSRWGVGRRGATEEYDATHTFGGLFDFPYPSILLFPFCSLWGKVLGGRGVAFETDGGMPCGDILKTWGTEILCHGAPDRAAPRKTRVPKREEKEGAFESGKHGDDDDHL
jgi:hypothetical protein